MSLTFSLRRALSVSVLCASAFGCAFTPPSPSSTRSVEAQVDGGFADRSAPLSTESTSIDCESPPPTALAHTEGRAVDYLVSCDLVITTPVEIGPGTVMAFKTGTALVVERTGTLEAMGTAEAPIELRSADPGASWVGVEVFSSSPRNQLVHTRVSNAGSPRSDLRAAVLVGAASFAGGKTSIRDCTIDGSRSVGLSIGEGGDVPTLERTTISGSADVPVEVNPNAIGRLGGAGNRFGGNAKNAARIVPINELALEQTDQTWALLDVPYLVNGAVLVAGVQTIDKGVTVLFADDAELTFGSVAGGIGYVKAVGASSQRVTFAPEGGAGRWSRIRLLHKNNVFEQCQLTGGGSLPDAFGKKGNLVLSADNGGADVSIRDSVIDHSGGFGVVSNGQPVMLSGTTFQNNAAGDLAP